MTIKEAGKKITDALTSIYDIHEANSIADLIIENLTGINRNEKAMHYGNPFVADEQKLTQIIKQLLNHRPVQYVLNEVWFYGLKFEVNETVLIPRPETEELVDWIISEAKNPNSKIQIPNSKFRILDIGTGSGCIPISIKKNIPALEVSTIDVCSEALHTAISNAVIHQTEINFQLLNFLEESKWKELGMYDIIVSNPPYIKSSEAKTMSEHVLEYEPHKALFVPDEDALLFYRKIADFALTHLNSNGVIYLEINQELGKETAELFQQKGFNVELKKDMSGNERMVKAVLGL